MKFVGVPPQHFLVLFAVTWCVAVAYVGALLSAVIRVRRLERPDEPIALMDILRSPPSPVEALGLLFGGRHKSLGDPLTTRLVLVARVLFAIGLPLILYLFWQAFGLASIPPG